MREHEYRGRCLSNDEWAYGDLQHNDISCRIISYSYTENEVGSCCEYCYHDVGEDTVGEFTGFCDKHNTRVYEDDIITDESLNIGVVEWRDGRFVIHFQNGNIIDIRECFESSHRIWIIGNTHDDHVMIDVSK